MTPVQDKTRKGPLVSAIMPFLNAERFMEESIESLLAQTYSNWELVLVDDGSTDSSTRIALKYVEKYPGRVSYVEHDGHLNRGISASRNAGVRQAKGKYVAFLDADDLWLPHKLQRQVEILEAEPRAAMLYGRTLYWSSWTGRPEDLKRDFIPDHGIPAETLYDPPSLLLVHYPLGQAISPSMSNLMLRRELLEKTGGFEEDFRGMYEDHAFTTKAYLKGSVFVSGEQWDQYRLHPESCCSTSAQNGQDAAIRRGFLTWFDRYTRQQGIHNESIGNAIQKAFRAGSVKPEVYYDGWVFRVAGTSEARLVVREDEPGNLRVAIDKFDNSKPYDIQLNRPNFRLKADQTYRVVFRARCAATRQVSLGVSMAHPPWGGLGMYRHPELTSEWQSFDEEFVATADEDNARVHFDLGSSDVAVEIGSIDLLTAAGAPASGSVQFGALRRVTPISRMWGYDRGLPVDRYYIEKFLRRQAGDIRGRVVEVSEDTYTRRYGANRVIRGDVLDIDPDNPHATIIADLTNAPHIPSNTFHCIVFTQTLHLIYDVRAAIQTLYRILKPDGILLATFPGISKNNDCSWSSEWHWGFTPLAAKKLFGEAFGESNITVEHFGNVLAVTSLLHGLPADELTGEELDYTESGYEVTIGLRAVKGVIEDR
ncbi:MAG TPA: glycosyltransferase [Bryobacteraceae bacterium]|jgi:GT2 family glycosyltransferase/SAM-dependent methyltransferase